MPHKDSPNSKRGVWAEDEHEYIRTHAATMRPEEIAKHLRRAAKSVKEWIAKNIGPVNPQTREEKERVEELKIRNDFRQTLAWKKLKDEFTADELEYFEEEYIGLVAQFDRDGVLKTEEQQIRKAITIDILMRRNMAARKKLLADIERLDNWQAKASREYRDAKASLSETERQSREEFLLNLETQLSSVRAAEQGKTREFADLDTRHQKLMEALKATREQRISKIESSKLTFLGVIRDLEDAEKREHVGRQNELMRRATAGEYVRLARPHKYDDGNEDQPVLSAESVELLDAETAEEEAAAEAEALGELAAEAVERAETEAAEEDEQD